MVLAPIAHCNPRNFSKILFLWPHLKLINQTSEVGPRFMVFFFKVSPSDCVARIENHCPRGTTQPKWATDAGRQLWDSKSFAVLSLP